MLLDRLAWNLLEALMNALKWMALLLVLVNVRSFPFLWHLRMFAPVINIHIRWRLFLLKLLFRPKKDAEMEKQRWLDNLSPVGLSPFELTVSHSCWAGPDDCDFNFHLSNSCYPKILDSVRLRAALNMFPAFFRHGGFSALGATHHNFIREIPIFAKYQVRMTVGSWDEKWLYILIRFVTPPRKHTKKSPKSVESISPVVSIPSTPAETNLGTATSSPSGTPASTSAQSPPLASALAAKLVCQPAPEPDGATLHCVAVSVVCFKMGRITVPPAVVIASEGLHRSPDVDAKSGTVPKRYSATNPPPTWTQHAQRLCSAANVKDYLAFMKGGWKDIPESERWWVDALGGEVEEQRVERLEILKPYREAAEGARGLSIGLP